MKSYLSVIAIVLSSVALGVSLFCGRSGGGVAFADVNKVISEFKGTKELEKELSAMENAGKFQLDSLGLVVQRELDELKIAEQGGNGAVLKEQQARVGQLEYRYESVRKNFEGQYAQKQQASFDAVSRQINAYAMDFGKANGYQLLLGANGSGNVLYGSDVIDVTDALLQFVNEKYEGK